MGKNRGKAGLFAAVIVFALTLSSARADDCQTVRLDQNGGSMAKIPVKDQGDLGTCYSYTSATLFDAWAASHLSEAKRPPHATSPLYLATLYKLEEKSSFACPKIGKDGMLVPLINSGTTCAAFKIATASRSCSEEELERYLRKNVGERETLSEIRRNIRETEQKEARERENLNRFIAKKSPYTKVQWQQIHDGMQEALKTHATTLKQLKEDELIEARKPHASYMKAVRTLYSDEWLQPHCSPEAKKAQASCAPAPSGGVGAESLSSSVTEDLVDKAARLTLSDFKRELDQVVCDKNHWGPPVSPCKPSCTFHSNTALDATAGKINVALNAPKALPIEIGFCAATIRSADQHRVWQEIEKIPTPTGNWRKHPRCGMHSALIIGQEKNPATGKCQYRLRNTWGAECSKRAACSNLSCRCESKTGDILVDRDLLLENSAGISTVEPEPEGSCK